MNRLLQLIVLGCSVFLGSGPALSQDHPTTCISRNAGSTIVRILCMDPGLRNVDAQLYAYLEGVHLPEYKQKIVRKHLEDWLQLRDRCQDAVCLRAFYKSSVPEWFELLEKIRKEESA